MAPGAPIESVIVNLCAGVRVGVTGHLTFPMIRDVMILPPEIPGPENRTGQLVGV